MNNDNPRQRPNASEAAETAAHNSTTTTNKDSLEPAQQHFHSRRPTSGPAYALYAFSSQWFLIPQGMGILAVILHQLPYQFPGLRIISKCIWIYTIVLLVSCLTLYTLRIILYPRHVLHQLRHNILETSCLASICIAFTSIIQMTALTLIHDWRGPWALITIILWWINTAMALLAVLGIPYIHVRLQPPGLTAIPPAILLPLIAALTSAAGGAVVCHSADAIGTSARLQIPVIIVSYLEIGIGLPLAICLETIYLARLFSSHDAFPAQREIYQTMILCGPPGQASFALQMLGAVVLRGTFAAYNRGTFLTADAAPVVGVASQFAGLLSWGFGTFWWVFALLSIAHTLLGQPGGWRKTRFSVGCWSLVFPWVSYGQYTYTYLRIQLINGCLGCIYQCSHYAWEYHEISGL